MNLRVIFDQWLVVHRLEFGNRNSNHKWFLALKFMQFQLSTKAFNIINAIIEQNVVFLHRILGNAVLEARPFKSKGTRSLVSN